MENNKKNSDVRLLEQQLKDKIKNFLDSYVTKPAMQTVEKEIEVQQDVVVIFMLHKITESFILDHGEDYYPGYLDSCGKEQFVEMKQNLKDFINGDADDVVAKKASEIMQKFINKKHLMAYLEREIKWIGISILSASYISSFILIRSVFELLVGISTDKTGSMSERIESIKFFKADEKKNVKKLWNKLNAWAHPYGKWEKEICPIYYSAEPLYHPKIYKECHEYYLALTDIFLVIAVERFKITAFEIKESFENLSPYLASIYFKKLPFFNERLPTD